MKKAWFEQVSAAFPLAASILSLLLEPAMVSERWALGVFVSDRVVCLSGRPRYGLRGIFPSFLYYSAFCR